MPGSTGHDGNEPHQPNAPTCRQWPRTVKAPANPARLLPDSERRPPVSGQSGTASSRRGSSTPPSTGKSPTPSRGGPTSSRDNLSHSSDTPVTQDAEHQLAATPERSSHPEWTRSKGCTRPRLPTHPVVRFARPG